VSTNLRIIGIDLGEIRIYPLPDLVLYWQSGKFAPINYSDLRASCHPSKYVETEAVPRDAKVVDKTWRYVNKNGSPDRRFNNNISIPVVAYAGMTLATTTGVDLDFHVSSLTSASEFVDLLSQRKSTAESHPPPDSKATTLPKLPDAERAAAILGINLNAEMEAISASYPASRPDVSS